MRNPTTTAQIAMLALSAAAELPRLPDQFFFDDDRTPLSATGVLERLALLNKPIAIRPVADKNALRLITGSIEKAQFARHYPDKIARIDAGRGFLRFLAERYSGSLDGLEVICRGAGAEARTTVAEFYAFQREYLIDCSNTVAGNFSDIEGVAAVLKFGGGAGGGTLEQVTPAA